MASDTGDALKTCWTCAHSGYPIPRGDACAVWQTNDVGVDLWWDSIEPDVDDDTNMPARDCGPCPGWGERTTNGERERNDG